MDDDSVEFLQHAMQLVHAALTFRSSCHCGVSPRPGFVSLRPGGKGTWDARGADSCWAVDDHAVAARPRELEVAGSTAPHRGGQVCPRTVGMVPPSGQVELQAFVGQEESPEKCSAAAAWLARSARPAAPQRR